MSRRVSWQEGGEGRERRQEGYSGVVHYPLLYKFAILAKDKHEPGNCRCLL